MIMERQCRAITARPWSRSTCSRSQGYTGDAAFVISLSDPRVATVADFETGQSNEGACRDEMGRSLAPFWGYVGYPELLQEEGEPLDILRIRYRGTVRKEESDAISPRNYSVCYARKDDRHKNVKFPGCADLPKRPEDEEFGVGETEEHAPPGLGVKPNRKSLSVPE
jgi:hypothetical protein